MNMRKDNMTNENDIGLINDDTSPDAMVEEQIARNMIELLNDRAQRLSATEEQRLLKARNLAVNHLAGMQTEAATHYGVHHGGHVLHWFSRHIGQPIEHHRVISTAVVVGVMLLTFFAVQHFDFNHNLENSDAFLLASDLPPEAYADKGFDAWLNTN